MMSAETARNSELGTVMWFNSCSLIDWVTRHQASVIEKVDNAIHWIHVNLYSVYNAMCFPNTYTRVFLSGYCYPLGPG